MKRFALLLLALLLVFGLLFLAAGPLEPQPAESLVIIFLMLSTAISVVLWAVISAIILSGVISLRDLDWFDRMAPEAAADGTDG